MKFTQSRSRPITDTVHQSRVAQLRESLRANPRTWLITGVAGFIGSNLLEHLLDLNQRVVGLDNFATGSRANIAEVLDARPDRAHRFELFDGDIRDPRACRRACANVDVVLHHAALASVPRSIEDPAEAHSVNVDGFFNVLLASKEAGVARFVYASSSAVYGDAPMQPQTEPCTGRPLSPYAAAKSINESYAAAFESSYGIATVGLRYYNVFGRRQDPRGAYAGVIPRWITTLLEGQVCEIYGDGETTRDFCHVANVVQANLLAAAVDDESVTGQVYNIGASTSVTLNELFSAITAALLREHALDAAPAPLYRPFRHGDVRHSSGSIDKARRLLGYIPTHDLRAGLADVVPAYMANAAGAFSSTPAPVA
jgi:UDP-N-acetylglucosamine 4-epimerase